MSCLWANFKQSSHVIAYAPRDTRTSEDSSQTARLTFLFRGDRVQPDVSHHHGGTAGSLCYYQFTADTVHRYIHTTVVGHIPHAAAWRQNGNFSRVRGHPLLDLDSFLCAINVNESYFDADQQRDFSPLPLLLLWIHLFFFHQTNGTRPLYEEGFLSALVFSFVSSDESY